MSGQQNSLDRVKSKIEDINNQVEKFPDLVAKLYDSRIRAKQGRREYTWTVTAQNESIQEEAIHTYSIWSSEAEALINQFLPHKLESFNETTESITERLYLAVPPSTPPSTYRREVKVMYQRQKGLVSSIPGRIETERLTDPRYNASQFATSEINRAHNFLDDGHVRAAGVVGGVALEEQLIAVCKAEDVKYDLNDGINALSQKLQEGEAISDDDQRLVKWIGGVRNTCAHYDEQEEPDSEKVRRALRQTEQFIQNHSGP